MDVCNIFEKDAIYILSFIFCQDGIPILFKYMWVKEERKKSVEANKYKYFMVNFILKLIDN